MNLVIKKGSPLLSQANVNQGDNYDIPELLRTKSVKPLDVKEYCGWKAKTTLLITGSVNKVEVNNFIEKLLFGLKKDLEPFTTKRRSAMWSELREVICTAVALDEEVHKSRALFKFDKWVGPGSNPWGFDFDDGRMESEIGFEDGQPGMNVELVVAPFFVKAGTADGDGYERQSYLSKCVVVCTESRKKLERS